MKDDFFFDSKKVATGEKAILEAHIEGPGVLSFVFNSIDDETNNNIIYTVDGKPVRNVKGGEKSSTQHSTQLSEGTHHITWVYNKKTATNGTFKLSNLVFKKAAITKPATAVNSLSGNTSGGGSTGLLFLSGLMLLMSGMRKFWRK